MRQLNLRCECWSSDMQWWIATDSKPPKITENLFAGSCRTLTFPPSSVPSVSSCSLACSTLVCCHSFPSRRNSLRFPCLPSSSSESQPSSGCCTGISVKQVNPDASLSIGFLGWGYFSVGLGTVGYSWENSEHSNTQQFCAYNQFLLFSPLSWEQISLIGPRDKSAIGWIWDFTIFLILHSKCCRILISAASFKCSPFLLYNPILSLYWAVKLLLWFEQD